MALSTIQIKPIGNDHFNRNLYRKSAAFRDRKCVFVATTKPPKHLIKMHLMYYVGGDGKRVYTLKKEDPSGKPTVSAHPARFSPDDQFSKQRIICKKRFGLLPTQKPDPLLAI